MLPAGKESIFRCGADPKARTHPTQKKKMSYEPPHLQIQQEFQLLPPEVRSDQIVCVIGPRRKVAAPGTVPQSILRYGLYDPALGNSFALKDLPAGETADQDGVEVLFSTVEAAYGLVSGSNGAVVGSSQWLLSLGSAFPSSQGLSSEGGFQRIAGLARDVRAGDLVRITHALGETEARIVSLHPEVSQPSVSDVADHSVFNMPGNPAGSAGTQGTEVVSSEVSGRTEADVPAQPGYAGDTSKGVVSETYTVQVVTGGGYDAAVVSWTSSGGDGSGTATVPADDTTPLAIGTRGAAVLFENLGARPLEAGEIFAVHVAAPFVRAFASLSGSFSGTVGTDYLITVVKGGAMSSNPRVAVTSSNGTDVSSVQTLSPGTPIVLGNNGLSVVLDGSVSQLNLGDTFVVSVTAPQPGAVRTARLSREIPSDGIDNLPGDSLDVEFVLVRSDVPLPAADFPGFGDLNWTHDGVSVSLEPGISVTDPSATDGSGVPLPLPVVRGEVEIRYTALLTQGSGTASTVSSLASLEGVLGASAPANELSFAVRMALLNSGGAHVVAIQTGGTSASDYDAALRTAEKMDDVYFIVPASQDPAVIESVVAHVGAMNAPRRARERAAVVSLPSPDETDIYVRKPDGSSWTGHVSADAGGAYAILTMPGAEFIQSGVRPGDVVRTGFSPLPGGGESFWQSAVAEVLTETSLRLTVPSPSAVGSDQVPVRTEISRIPTGRERAEAGRDAAESIGDRKVFNVWTAGDVYTVSSEKVGSHFAAAAIAGLASSVVAHQPITEFEVAGFSSVPGLGGLTPDEIDVAAGGGNLVLMQDRPGGRVYVRHQISTDNSGPMAAEMSITRGADMITRYLRTAVRPLLGRYNITPEFLQMVETLSQQRLDAMVLALSTTTAGPPILENDPIRAFQDPSSMTGFFVDVPVLVPKPANRGTIRIYIS